jgi:hypothetical protein
MHFPKGMTWCACQAKLAHVPLTSRATERGLSWLIAEAGEDFRESMRKDIEPALPRTRLPRGGTARAGRGGATGAPAA